MKRYTSILALVLALGGVVHATYSQIRLTQLGVEGDKYKVSLFADANQTDFVATKTKSWSVVSPYYESGCTCYHVPLSVLGFTQNQIDQAVSATGQRIIGGVTPMESIVLILDAKSVSRLNQQRFGAKPLHLWRDIFVGIFDGSHIVGDGGGKTGKR